MSSFKSKLRSQIKKGIKNELTVKINHSDSFNEFYTLYSKSLHRLGTPVNGKDYFKEFLINIKMVLYLSLLSTIKINLLVPPCAFLTEVFSKLCGLQLIQNIIT